ncbi:MAG: endonuclease III, partial [Clostridia bacterium]
VQAMAEASVEDVYLMVKSCGFRSKASHIVESCRLILQRHGGEVPAEMGALMALPGVGQKTANVVLANAFGVPTIAVDTHVFRVSNRLGLADAKNVQLTEEQLQKAIPKRDWVAAHHWLIFHGRRVCHARNPECETCTLRTLCKAASAVKASSAQL